MPISGPPCGPASNDPSAGAAGTERQPTTNDAIAQRRRRPTATARRASGVLVAMLVMAAAVLAAVPAGWHLATAGRRQAGRPMTRLGTIGGRARSPITASAGSTSLGGMPAGTGTTIAAGAGWRGYWLVTRHGRVLAHRAPSFGSLKTATRPGPPARRAGSSLDALVIGIAPTADDQGYWEVTAAGAVTSFGDATVTAPPVQDPGTPGDPVVAIVADDATGGYWLATRNGRVIAHDAPAFGQLPAPAAGRTAGTAVVAMAATSDDRGYWLVTSAGTVTAFGDAVQTDGPGSQPSTDPVVGIAADRATGGFWLVTRDGSVIAHDAPTFGHLATSPPSPGPTSTGPGRTGTTVVSLAPSADDRGYWLVTSAGTVVGFGDASPRPPSTARSARGPGASAQARRPAVRTASWRAGAPGRTDTGPGIAANLTGVTTVGGAGTGDPVVGIAADDLAPPAGTAPGLAPAPLVVTTLALAPARQGVPYRQALAATGGTPARQWALASGWIPPGIELSPDGVLQGTPSSPGTYDFTVTVADAVMLSSQAAVAHLSITVDQPMTPSARWAGYSEGGSGFTMVAGDFTVPDLVATGHQASASEWVGIDGATNASLVQAGVEESYDPATNQVAVSPWWEILPEPQVSIAMTIHPGDVVSVTIARGAGDVWSIQLADLSTGARFSTERTYTGPATSADWIVEAPTSAVTGAVDPLGEMSPNVTFSAMDFVGSARTLTEWAIDQGPTLQATPSSLTPAGFAVASGASPPPAP